MLTATPAIMNFLAEHTINPLEHVLPHELIHHGPTWVTNQMVMATLAALLMLLVFPVLFRRADPGAPRGARNLFESILEFLRVEVFRPALKEHTDRFLPFLWTLFFFILFCNLLGAIPFGAVFTLMGAGEHSVWAHLGGTATGTVSTTGALALCAFLFIHANGIAQVYRALRDGSFGHHDHHEEHSSDGGAGHDSAHDLDHMRGEGLAADVPGNFQAITDPTHHYADDQHVRVKGAAAVVGPAGVTPTAGHADPHAAPGKGKSAGEAALMALPLYLWNFAPHPFKPGPQGGSWVADIPVWAMLLVLELVGALIKPFALSIRLFANMVAGHVVLAALVGLIVLVPTLAAQIAVGSAVTVLGLMISLLELFVAFLQAYIFTFLTTLFIASAVAPEH